MQFRPPRVIKACKMEMSAELLALDNFDYAEVLPATQASGLRVRRVEVETARIEAVQEGGTDDLEVEHAPESAADTTSR